jgi:hypothetical protein
LIKITQTLITPINIQVTGKIVQRLLNVLRATSKESTSEMSQHTLFAQISLAMRMLLMVSFDNLIEARHFLPEVVFFCSVLFANGDWIQRVTVHRLLLNLAHAAYLRQRQESQDSSLLMVLMELDSPKFKVHFG